MDVVIVTMCTKDWVWGVYLLIASLRYNNVKTRVNVFGFGFDDRDKALLEQFDNVKVIIREMALRRQMTFLKADTLLSAEPAEYLAWIDCDCLVKGDVTKYLSPPDDAFHIRVRSTVAETCLRFRHRYTNPSEFGHIPEAVLDIWKKDVGENETPRMDSTVVTNCFVFHKKHIGFIRKWRGQISKISSIPYNDDVKLAYGYGKRLSDELIMSSLFLFAVDAPPIGKYQFDDTSSGAYLVHFAPAKKPWEVWTLQSVKYLDYVLSLIRYAKEKGYELPALVWSLREENRALCYLSSYVYYLIATAKILASNIVWPCRRYLKNKSGRRFGP